MYKVFFEKNFFEWFHQFLISLKNQDFERYQENEIVQIYSEIPEKIKTDILNTIHTICENWMIWRKVIYNFKNIENCSHIFEYENYKVCFFAIKNDEINEIIVNNLKIKNR